MTNTTQPTPADLAALVADLNAIIAEQEARLRSQEAQISEQAQEIMDMKGWIWQYRQNSDRIGKYLEPIREKRSTGEPARGDADEVRDLVRQFHVLSHKAATSLANNLCPDHRDKQEGKPCLACEIERLYQATAYAAQVTR